MKENKKTLIITSMVCLIPVIVGIILYPSLPEQLTTHWDISGKPNGYESKLVGAIVFPAVMLLVNISLPLLMRLDPKYENMSPKLKTVVFWSIPLVSLICSSATLASGFEIETYVQVVTPLSVGLLFVFIGNYLPKTKQSYMMGIKLPWTLDNEENWNKTHRLAGFIWVVGGLLIMISSFFKWRIYVMLPVFVAMILVPSTYSYLIYRKMSENGEE
ncbi:SdpI family protein [Butyrivibrio sp. X503]|uniref:SdpI family protein n=1 Tax=Butyrivibrio sp. X503 TaxID=2364878 RepID=UPI0013140FCD|nr:SdpI family protein [Butyrivibrio sp. X503]